MWYAVLVSTTLEPKQRTVTKLRCKSLRAHNRERSYTWSGDKCIQDCGACEWRVRRDYGAWSRTVQELHHPPNFPWILAATLGCQNNMGCTVPSSTSVDTGTGEVSLSLWSSLSRVLISLTAGDEDELEEDVEQWLPCLKSVLEVDTSDPEDEFDKPGNTIGTKFSVLQIIRIPF